MDSNTKFQVGSIDEVDLNSQPELCTAYGKDLYDNLNAALELLENMATSSEEGELLIKKNLILTSALDEARMDSENGRKRGTEYIDAVERRLGNLMQENKVTSIGFNTLTQCWLNSGLKVPKVFAAVHEKYAEALSNVEIPPEVVSELRQKLEQGIDLSDPEGLTKLVSVYSIAMSTTPEALQYALVRAAIAENLQIYANLGFSLLLLDFPTVRSGVIDGFTDRLKSGALTTNTVQTLTTIRSWMTDNSTTSQIDQLIQAAIKSGLKVSDRKQNIKYHTMLASWVDGVGAQAIAVSVQNENSRHVVLSLHKQGFGVKDVMLIPCHSANSQRAQMQNLKNIMPEGGAVSVSIEFVKQAVKIALHDGFKNGKMPTPDLVEYTQIMGFSDVRPSDGTIEDILSSVDPEGRITSKTGEQLETLLAESEHWNKKLQVMSNWFENSDDIDEILKNGKPEEEIWSVLEKRRDHWAMCIGRTAMLLHQEKSELLDSFIAVLKAMAGGMDLQKIPVMDVLVSRTIQNWELENSAKYKK